MQKIGYFGKFLKWCLENAYNPEMLPGGRLPEDHIRQMEETFPQLPPPRAPKPSRFGRFFGRRRSGQC